MLRGRAREATGEYGWKGFLGMPPAAGVPRRFLEMGKKPQQPQGQRPVVEKQGLPATPQMQTPVTPAPNAVGAVKSEEAAAAV